MPHSRIAANNLWGVAGKHDARGASSSTLEGGDVYVSGTASFSGAPSRTASPSADMAAMRPPTAPTAAPAAYMGLPQMLTVNRMAAFFCGASGGVAGPDGNGGDGGNGDFFLTSGSSFSGGRNPCCRCRLGGGGGAVSTRAAQLARPTGFWLWPAALLTFGERLGHPVRPGMGNGAITQARGLALTSTRPATGDRR